MQHRLHVWHGLSKCFERWRQYLHGWNRNLANVQLALFTAGQSTHPFDRFISVFQQLADLLEEKLPLRREHHAARASAQKVDTDLLLQVPHLSAQRRLRNVKPRSGLGEVQHFPDHQKVSQMSQFHRWTPLCRKSMAARGRRYWSDSKPGGKQTLEARRERRKTHDIRSQE